MTDQTPDIRTRVADLIDAHEWSRLHGGSVGEQIADRLLQAGLLRQTATGVGDNALRADLIRVLDSDEWMQQHFGIAAHAHDVVDALLPRIREHIAAAVQAERERVSALLAAVPDEYYPQDVFGGPFSTDESRTANEALREHGLSIDRIAANVMRHAFRNAARIARGDPDHDE